MKKILILPLLIILAFSIPIAYADEDYEDDEYDEERTGFGIMEQEREREREHQDDKELAAVGSDMGNVILYGTIGIIVASIGYTAFKIYKTRRPVISKR